METAAINFLIHVIYDKDKDYLMKKHVNQPNLYISTLFNHNYLYILYDMTFTFPYLTVS